MFQKIIEQMGANMLSSANDYIKDGLIYCGNCNTPKQVFVRVLNKNMPIPCKCRKEQLKQEEEREEKIKKQRQIDRLRQASLLGEKYQNALFENTETTHSKEFAVIYSRCKKYCDIADAVLKKGVGIYLFGEDAHFIRL